MEEARIEDLTEEPGRATGPVEAPDPGLEKHAEFRASQILYQDLKSARSLEAVEALRAEFAALLPAFLSPDDVAEFRRQGNFAFAEATRVIGQPSPSP